MASKTTYVYQVMMGHGDKVDKVSYCYGRNMGVVVPEYQKQFSEEKYDSIKVKMIGIADIKKHPGPFEPMPQDEIDYILKNNIGQAEKYAYRRPHSQGQMMTKEEVESLFK